MKPVKQIVGKWQVPGIPSGTRLSDAAFKDALARMTATRPGDTIDHDEKDNRSEAE